MIMITFIILLFDSSYKIVCSRQGVELRCVHCKGSIVVLTTDWLLMLCSMWIMLVMWVAPSVRALCLTMDWLCNVGVLLNKHTICYSHDKHSSKNGAVTIITDTVLVMWVADDVSIQYHSHITHLYSNQSILSKQPSCFCSDIIYIYNLAMYNYRLAWAEFPPLSGNSNK